MLGITNDAALRTAKWDVYSGAFPCHPGSQCPDFIECDRGVIANATFARSASIAMLHAEAFEYTDRAIVHFDGKGHGQSPPRPTQNLTKPRIQPHFFSSAVELPHGDSETVEVF